MKSAETSPTLAANGEPDRDQLVAAVRKLENECAELKRSLAQVEAERDRYLKAIYEKARESFHFEDVDIADLERSSAGPVQSLE
jgi:hypothetical protein